MDDKNKDKEQEKTDEQQAQHEPADNELVRRIAEQKYEFGFTTDVHTEIIPVGLNEDVVRLISQKKGEPEWMLDFRLKAFRYWQEQQQPTWGHVTVPPIDYQAISYYADPPSTIRPSPTMPTLRQKSPPFPTVLRRASLTLNWRKPSTSSASPSRSASPSAATPPSTPSWTPSR